MLRSSPPEVFSNKGTLQIQSQPTGEQTPRIVIPTKPLCNFIEITPMHGCAPENPHQTRKNLSLGEHPWETAPVCQNSFQRLKLQNVILYNC